MGRKKEYKNEEERRERRTLSYRVALVPRTGMRLGRSMFSILNVSTIGHILFPLSPN